jgi:hypothetical protein
MKIVSPILIQMQALHKLMTILARLIHGKPVAVDEAIEVELDLIKQTWN